MQSIRPTKNICLEISYENNKAVRIADYPILVCLEDFLTAMKITFFKKNSTCLTHNASRTLKILEEAYHEDAKRCYFSNDDDQPVVLPSNVFEITDDYDNTQCYYFKKDFLKISLHKFDGNHNPVIKSCKDNSDCNDLTSFGKQLTALVHALNRK